MPVIANEYWPPSPVKIQQISGVIDTMAAGEMTFAFRQAPAIANSDVSSDISSDICSDPILEIKRPDIYDNNR